MAKPTKNRARGAHERKFKAAELDAMLVGGSEGSLTLKEQLALMARAHVHARRRRRR